MSKFSKKESKSDILERESKEKKDKSHIIFILFLDKIIKAIEGDVDEFIPSIGNKSMSKIDEQAKYKFNKLISSREFISMNKEPERKLEISPMIKELSKIRPSRWSSEAFFAVQQIKAKAIFYLEDSKNKDIVNKINEKFVWN